MSVQALADEGEKIIFGGIGKNKEQGAVGKGQCPLCHAFHAGMLGERAPNLVGLPGRAGKERLEDPKYSRGSRLEETLQKRRHSLVRGLLKMAKNILQNPMPARAAMLLLATV